MCQIPKSIERYYQGVVGVEGAILFRYCQGGVGVEKGAGCKIFFGI